MIPSPELRRKPTVEILKPLEADEEYYKDKLEDINKRIVALKEKVEPHKVSILKQTSDPLMFGVEIARRMEEALRYLDEIITYFEDREQVYKKMFETIKLTIPKAYILKGKLEGELEEAKEQVKFWKARYREDDFEKATIMRLFLSNRPYKEQCDEYCDTTGKSRRAYELTIEKIRRTAKAVRPYIVQPSPIIQGMVKKSEALLSKPDEVEQEEVNENPEE